MRRYESTRWMSRRSCNDIISMQTEGLRISDYHIGDYQSFQGPDLEGWVCSRLSSSADTDLPPLFTLAASDDASADLASLRTHTERCQKAMSNLPEGASMKELATELLALTEMDIQKLPEDLRPCKYELEPSSHIKDQILAMRGDPSIATSDPTQMFCNTLQLLDDHKLPYFLKCFQALHSSNACVYLVLAGDWVYAKVSALLETGRYPGAGIVSRGGFYLLSVGSGNMAPHVETIYTKPQNKLYDFIKNKYHSPYLENTGRRNLGAALAKHGDLATFMKDCERSHLAWGMPADTTQEQLIRDREWGEYILSDEAVRRDLLQGMYLEHLSLSRGFRARQNMACELPIGFYCLIWYSGRSHQLLSDKTPFVIKDANDIKSLKNQRGSAVVVAIDVDSPLTSALLVELGRLSEQTPVVCLIDKEDPIGHGESICGKPEAERKKLAACYKRTYSMVSQPPLSWIILNDDIQPLEAAVLEIEMQSLAFAAVEPRVVHLGVVCGIPGSGKSVILGAASFKQQFALSSGVPEERIVVVEGDSMQDRPTLMKLIRDIYADSQYNVVLLDRNTVGLNGFLFLENHARACEAEISGLTVKIFGGVIQSASTSGPISLPDFAVCLASVLSRSQESNPKLHGGMPNATKIAVDFLGYMGDNGRYHSNQCLSDFISGRLGHCALLPITKNLAAPADLAPMMQHIIEDCSQETAKEYFAREDVLSWLVENRPPFDEMAREWAVRLSESMLKSSAGSKKVNERLEAGSKKVYERLELDPAALKQLCMSLSCPLPKNPHVTLLYSTSASAVEEGAKFVVEIQQLIITPSIKAFKVVLPQGPSSQNGEWAHITLETDAKTPASKVAGIMREAAASAALNLERPIVLEAIFKRTFLPI